jgi:hypothetical protein
MNAGVLMWVVTAASLVGTVANIYQRRWCFWVWLVTNALWAVYDCWLGAWAQAALMATYTVLAVWGLARWKPETEAPHA